MGKMEQSVSAIRIFEDYIRMAMDGPRFRQIVAKSWSISHLHARPSFRAITAATDAIFRTAFPSLFQGG